MKLKLFILILCLMPAVCFGDGMTFRAGQTSSLAPGKHTDTTIQKVDVGYKWINKYVDNEVYITGIYSNEYAVGIGDRLSIDYSVCNVVCTVEGGLLVLNDNVPVLAESALYGTLGASIMYKGFVIGFDHVSSPFHSGEDGDVGLNTLFVGFNIKF